MTIVVAAQRRAEFPRRVESIDIEFRIDGAGIEREHAERAIQLSFERYCSVAASLAPDIVTETRLTLERRDVFRRFDRRSGRRRCSGFLNTADYAARGPNPASVA